MRTVTLFDLPILAVSRSQVVKQLSRILSAKSSVSSSDPVLVMTPNPEQLVQAQGRADFAAALAAADYLLPDGIGLVWASRYWHRLGRLPYAISERIAGVEVVSALLEQATAKHLPVLLIGGQAYVSQVETHSKGEVTSAAVLGQLSPQLLWTAAYQDKQAPTAVEEAVLVKLLHDYRPAVVFVGLGAPEQELWLMQHRQLLATCGVRLAMAVGGSFDFLLARVQRAPVTWQKLGLEWLWRLLQQPWRWQRQLRLLSFVYLVLTRPPAKSG